MNKEAMKLKRKARSCSAKAATTSLLIHAGLILLAGSVVAVRYVQKKNAEFTATIAQPKLERRQLQMPAKLERVRQTTRRPRIVSRSVSAASPEFVAPDMGPVGKLSTQKFSMPFARSGRDFSALTRGIGVTLPKVRFFDIRTEGEKFVFIIDGSQKMLSEETGGLAACERIKSELLKTVSEMSSSLLFNVIFHDGVQVKQFSPKMMPVTSANLTALTEWVAPMLSDPAEAGIAPEENTYEAPVVYETAMGDEASGWLRSLQAAFEQRPDNVFIVGQGWGCHRISPEKGQLLLDFSLWEILSSGGAFSVAGSDVLREDRELRNDLIQEAIDAILKEEDQMALDGDEPQFLRNLLDYVQYSENQVIDHVNAVHQANYGPYQLAPPRVHFVRLVSEEGNRVSDADTEKISKLVRTYTGELGFCVGTGSGTSGSEGEEGAQVLAAAGAAAPKSSFYFMGSAAEGSRIAFLLDASKEMLSEATGGTNTYGFIKEQLVKTVALLDPGSLFNVILYDGEHVALYQPEMARVGDVAEALEGWLAGINADGDAPGLAAEQSTYVAPNTYPTAFGSDVTGLPRALQAAMEQKADSILIFSKGIGRLPVRREKARRLLEFSIWDVLGSSSGTVAAEEDEEDEEGADAGSSDTAGTSSSGGLLASLQQDRKQRSALIRRTLQRIEEEKKEREASELPLGFVHDILSYVEYTPEQLQSHLAAVSRAQYIGEDEELQLPEMHFVCLVEAGSKPDQLTMREIRGMLRGFEGGVKVFRGADSRKGIVRANRLLEMQP